MGSCLQTPYGWVVCLAIDHYQPSLRLLNPLLLVIFLLCLACLSSCFLLLVTKYYQTRLIHQTCLTTNLFTMVDAHDEPLHCDHYQFDKRIVNLYNHCKLIHTIIIWWTTALLDDKQIINSIVRKQISSDATWAFSYMVYPDKCHGEQNLSNHTGHSWQ